MFDAEKIKKEIGERIKEKREEMNLSQEQLADMLGYKSKTSIHKVEQGMTDLPQSKIIEFAKALNTSPAYLMGWKEEREFRNKLFHTGTLSTSDKINFIKNIEKHLKDGMTYREIAEILDFPKIEKIMQHIVFGQDLLQLAKKDENIFNLLVDTVNSTTKKIFSDSNLSFTEEDAEINKETFEQVMNKMNTVEVLKAELKKYSNHSDENFKYIKSYINQIKNMVKIYREKGKKYPFDIVHSNGEIIEFKMINNKNYIFTFNINDNPIEVEYYPSPFGNVPEEKVLYNFLLENSKNFFNSSKITMFEKEKLINALQEEFFKAKFNIKENK